jgi:hypothetical protein
MVTKSTSRCSTRVMSFWESSAFIDAETVASTRSTVEERHYAGIERYAANSATCILPGLLESFPLLDELRLLQMVQRGVAELPARGRADLELSDLRKESRQLRVLCHKVRDERRRAPILRLTWSCCHSASRCFELTSISDWM